MNFQVKILNKWHEVQLPRPKHILSGEDFQLGAFFLPKTSQNLWDISWAIYRHCSTTDSPDQYTKIEVHRGLKWKHHQCSLRTSSMKTQIYQTLYTSYMPFSYCYFFAIAVLTILVQQYRRINTLEQTKFLFKRQNGTVVWNDDLMLTSWGTTFMQYNMHVFIYKLQLNYHGYKARSTLQGNSIFNYKKRSISWRTSYLNKTTVFSIQFGTHIDWFCMEWTTFTHKNQCLTLQVLEAFCKVMPPAHKLFCYSQADRLWQVMEYLLNISKHTLHILHINILQTIFCHIE